MSFLFSSFRESSGDAHINCCQQQYHFTPGPARYSAAHHRFPRPLPSRQRTCRCRFRCLLTQNVEHISEAMFSQPILQSQGRSNAPATRKSVIYVAPSFVPFFSHQSAILYCVGRKISDNSALSISFFSIRGHRYPHRRLVDFILLYERRRTPPTVLVIPIPREHSLTSIEPGMKQASANGSDNREM